MPSVVGVFSVWTVIPLGLRWDVGQYLSVFEKRGITVGKIARAVLQKIKVEESHAPAKIVRVTGADFGLDNNSPVSEICRHALESGLGLCRPEVALSLREQYASQPRGEVLWIAAEPLDSRYGLGYFSVGHDSRGPWLCFGCGGPDCWWGKARCALLSPAMQEKLVSMNTCECAWSRRGNDPISVIFEK